MAFGDRDRSEIVPRLNRGGDDKVIGVHAIGVVKGSSVDEDFFVFVTLK